MKAQLTLTNTHLASEHCWPPEKVLGLLGEQGSLEGIVVCFAFERNLCKDATP